MITATTLRKTKCTSTICTRPFCLEHLLGLNHERLTYRYGGRDFRLTDVHGEIVHGILAQLQKLFGNRCITLISSSQWLALWLLNSGAYMLWMFAIPVW